MYSLTIETDDDFSVVYKKKIYTGDFSLLVANHEELAIIKENLGGPYGSDTGGKSWDIKNCMQQIVDGALNDFNMTGGNRAISWHYVSDWANQQRAAKIAERGEYMAGYLDGLDAAIVAIKVHKEIYIESQK